MIVMIKFTEMHYIDIPKRFTTNPTNNTKKACALNIRSLRFFRCEKNNYGQAWF